MTPIRHALLQMAGCAALSFTLSSHAMDSGTVLAGSQVPDWAVGNKNCSGTLITPRVTLTGRFCIDPGLNTGFYLRKTGQYYWGKTIAFPDSKGAMGAIALVMTDAALTSRPLEMAPIASYQEERAALQDGDEAQTRGTPLVVYANDGDSENFATTARTTDAYHNRSKGMALQEGRKMFYRSARNYRQVEPQRLKDLLLGWSEFMFKDLRFTDQDVDDSLIFTAGLTDGINDSPVYYIDAGGSVLFRRPDGGLRLIATLTNSATHPRLSSLWPWIVKTMVDNGLRDDALFLSRNVLGTPAWGARNRVGQVGQIFAYDNPYSRRIEYLRLANVDTDSRYGSFPINQRDNDYWEYLGTQLPDIEQATTPIKTWEGNDRRGAVGDIFIYNNPYSRQVEYFRLAALGGDGRYWYFPINQKNNPFWEYLGTDLPSRRLKFTGLP